MLWEGSGDRLFPSGTLLQRVKTHTRGENNVSPFAYHLTGVHPYWVGDLDSIILRNLDLYGSKKPLSQQLVIKELLK